MGQGLKGAPLEARRAGTVVSRDATLNTGRQAHCGLLISKDCERVNRNAL